MPFKIEIPGEFLVQSLNDCYKVTDVFIIEMFSKNEHVNIISRNLSTSELLYSKFPCTVIDEGRVLIDGMKLLLLVRTIKEIITIKEESNNKISIKFGKRKLHLPIITEEVKKINIPQDYSSYKDSSIQVNNLSEICNLLLTSLTCVDPKIVFDSHKTIKIVMDSNLHTVVVHSLSSHVFYKNTFTNPNIDKDLEVTLNHTSVLGLSKLFVNNKSIAKLILGSNWFSISSITANYFTWISSYKFPDTSQVWSKNIPEYKVHVNVDNLKEIIERTIILSTDKIKDKITSLPVLLTINNNKLTLTVEDMQEEEIDIMNPSDGILSVKLNPPYIKKLLYALRPTDLVEIGFKSTPNSTVYFSDMQGLEALIAPRI